MSKPLKISEQAAVQMPMKTVASLICMVALYHFSSEFVIDIFTASF